MNEPTAMAMMYPSRRRPRVLLDVDDVLVDFETAAETLVSDLLGREWTVDEGPQEWDLFQALNERQIRLAMTVIHTPGWSVRLKPHARSIKAVHDLQEVSDVYTLTSAISWADERSDYLQYHFGIDKAHQVYTKAKYLVGGDFMIDDCPKNIIEWTEEFPNGVGMLWNSRNNQRVTDCSELRVPSWDHVIERVRAWPGRKA